MATITEDYVSFEIAKLLREKGFDETCYACYEYFSSSITTYSGWPFEYKGEPVHNSKNIIKCPTLQMAMKWLREVHDLHIIVSPYKVGNEEKSFHWCCEVYKSFNLLGCRIYVNETPKSYEEGVEIAIRYCLEHLIHLAKKSK